MYETSNDLASTTRRSAIEMLNEHLADAIDLHLQAKQAHWNIKGPNFVGLHELFDRVAAQADEYSDLIAERAVALGYVPDGQARAVAAGSPLSPVAAEAIDFHTLVRAMTDRVAQVSESARERMDRIAEWDAVSQDGLIDVVRALEQQQWMLRAQLSDRA